MIFPFLLAFSALIFSTALIPTLHLVYFAPFLAIAIFRKPLLSCFWIALFSGLITDLFSSELRFGLTAFSFSITVLLVYGQKRNFFEDKPVSFFIMTALISSISSAIHLCFYSFFDKKLMISGPLIATDLLGMPLVDGLYAFFWFTCPLLLLRHVRKVGLRGLFGASQ